MGNKPFESTRYAEDDIDLDRIKRNMSTISFVKKRNNKRLFVLGVARFLLFFISLGLFLFLFSLASEVISLF